MPSETTAESSDSIAASMAIVRAEGINSRTSRKLNGGKWGVGSERGMPPNLLPIVATSCKSNSQTASEAATTATIMPGTRGTIRRSSTINATLPMPTQAVAGRQVHRVGKIARATCRQTPAGTSPIFNPRRSLICEEKMITAMPEVKPVVTG